jgi:PAS domain S-box-containing protein
MNTVVTEALINLEEDEQRPGSSIRGAERFRAAMDQLIVGHMLFDAIRSEHGYITDFTCVYANEAAAKVAGKTPEWFIGRRFLEEFTSDGNLELYRRYVNLVETGEQYEDEITYDHNAKLLIIQLLAVKSGDGFSVSYTDITAKRLAEDRARKEEARYQVALDAGAFLGTWTWDIQLNRVQADVRFASAFGVDPERCLSGVPVEDMIASVHPEDQSGLTQAIQSAISTGSPFRERYRVKGNDARFRWVEARGSVVFDAHGTPLHFPGVLLDVDDWHRVEAERDRALALLESFVEAVPGLVYANDLNGRLLIGNKGLAKIYDMPPELYLGRTAAELFEDQQQALTIMQNDRRIMQSGVAEQVEEEATLKDGQRTVWLSTKSPLRDASGNVIGITGTSIDITARKLMEDELRESEAKLQALTNSVEQLIWSSNAEGKNDFHNDRWYEYTGLPFGSTDGDSWLDVFHPEDRDRTWRRWQECVRTGEPYEVEYRIRHRSGEYRWVIGRAVPVKDKLGAITRWYGTCTDIHELKSAKEALANHVRVLDILNRTGATIASEIDLERIVQTVTDAGVELSGAEFGAFFYNLINESGESYTLYTISGVEREAFSKFPMPRNTAVFAPTFRGDGVVRSDDITADPRYGKNAPHVGMPEGHLPVRSYLAVPVLSRSGEALGGLFFGHSKPGVFTERSEELLVGIAGQAAVAVDNAYLYRAAQQEIVARRHNEEALARAEEFSRSVIESNADAIAVLEPDGRLQFVNRNGRHLFKATNGAKSDYGWIDHWSGECRNSVRGAVQQALASGKGHLEALCPTLSGESRWWDIIATSVQDIDGTPVRVVLSCRDITDQKQTEEARQLLLRELNHRVKNLFAIASGMVTMTARSATSVSEMADAVKGRLLALAKAHELIRSAITNDMAGEESASLRTLLEEVLRPHLLTGVHSVEITGPDVSVGVTAATSFALIFHELATNAAKYGALNEPGGRLSVSWMRDAEHLRVNWFEVGPKQISGPTQKGFGSRLAETSATNQLGGRLTYDWRDNGVVIDLAAPLERIEL